jgi:hypothetical protein
MMAANNDYLNSRSIGNVYQQINALAIFLVIGNSDNRSVVL